MYLELTFNPIARLARRSCALLLLAIGLGALEASSRDPLLSGPSQPPPQAAMTSSWTLGPKRILVLRLEFPDQRGETVTAAAALAMLNGPVARYFAENSYGQTTLTATATRLYLMPRTAAFYAADRTAALDNDAMAAASADHDVAGFDRLVFIYNYSLAGYPDSALTFNAMAAVRGERLWINGGSSFQASTVIHELGHTFGLMHANLWSVTDGNPVSDSGRIQEYGDPFDLMGAAFDLRAHFNPAEKVTLGWLPASAITPVAQSGTYRVYRFDDGAASLQRPLALSILRDGSQWYWVSYRAGLPENTALSSGAHVIWGNVGSGATTQLLDCSTPGNNANDAALAIGQILTDARAGVTLRPLARDGVGNDQYLDIEVTLQPRSGIVTPWGALFYSSAQIPAGLADIRAIAGGYGHAVALKSDGTVVGWGSNGSGETSIPAGLKGVVAVAARYETSGALKEDGTVVLWGSNRWGQVDPPAGLKGVRQLVLGTQHTMVLKSDGTIASWGNALPPGFDQLSSIVAIAAGDATAIALRSDGTVVAWDARRDMWPADIMVPMPPDLRDVVAVAAGHYHFLALRADGTLVAWGHNQFGQASVPAGLSRVRSVVATQENTYALKDDGTVVVWGSNHSQQTVVPPGLNGVEMLAHAGAPLALVSTGELRIRHQPGSQSTVAGQRVSLSTLPAGAGPWRYQWQRNGRALLGETRGMLTVKTTQPADAGIYTAVVTNSSSNVHTNAAVLGVTSSAKVIGAGSEVAAGIVHPNGNIFDQVLLTGVAESITADRGEVTRTSFIDLSDDIVQVEFSGAGTLSVVLDAASTVTAAPLNYHQPAVSYMKGHAGIVITGADETTHVAVFTVGRATAFDPTGAYDITRPIGAANDPTKNGSPLFQGHGSTAYDGIADLAFIAISSATGKFGGLRTSNVHYFSGSGLTGIHAPGVAFQGPLYIGNIAAFDTATPVIQVGSVTDARITGGDLAQDNAKPVQVSGLTTLQFTAGSDSHGGVLPAQPNRGVLEQDGTDVTSRVVAGQGL